MNECTVIYTGSLVSCPCVYSCEYLCINYAIYAAVLLIAVHRLICDIEVSRTLRTPWEYSSLPTTLPPWVDSLNQFHNLQLLSVTEKLLKCK